MDRCRGTFLDEQMLVDVFPRFDIGLSDKFNLTERCLRFPVHVELVLEEGVVRVAADEVELTRRKDNEEDARHIDTVKGHHELVGGTSARELLHLLVGLDLLVAKPVAELANLELVVEGRAFLLVHEVVRVAEDLWQEPIAIALSLHWAEGRCQDVHALELAGDDELGECVTESSHLALNDA